MSPTLAGGFFTTEPPGKLQYDNLYVHPCSCKWHYFIPFYSWVIFHCVYVPHLLSHSSGGGFEVLPAQILAPSLCTGSWFRIDRFKTENSVQFSHSVMSDSLQPHDLQHTRPLCPSPTPGACSNSCPLSQWCYPAISSSVIPFSSCLQPFPASGSFPMSQFFTSGGQIGASAIASVLPMNIQDWFPLGWTIWISLQSKGLSRVFSNTTVQKYPLGTQLSLWSNSHIHTWLLEET